MTTFEFDNRADARAIPDVDRTFELFREFLHRSQCVGDATALDSIAHSELTLNHLRILFQLGHTADGLPLHEIADAAALSVAATGRNVDKLVTLGLVDRREDLHDRRIKRVSLSAQGEKELEMLSAHKEDALRALLRMVPTDKRVRLHDALDSIINDDFWTSGDF